jgi:hypothetical protein
MKYKKKHTPNKRSIFNSIFEIKQEETIIKGDNSVEKCAYKHVPLLVVCAVVPETVTLVGLVPGTVALVGLLPLVVEVLLPAVVGGSEVTFTRKKRLTIVYTYKYKQKA